MPLINDANRAGVRPRDPLAIITVTQVLRDAEAHRAGEGA